MNVNDDELRNKLKAYRMQKSAGGKAPQYGVFTNAMMEDLIKAKPQTLTALRLLKGWGDKRIEKYGEDIIKIFKVECKRSSAFSK